MMKNVLISTVTVMFFVACDAGDKIQSTIDDIQEEYFEEQVVGSYDESNVTLSDEELNASLSQQKLALLKTHNDARAEVGVNNALVWDNTLEAAAQVYADVLAKKGTFEHDPKNRSNAYGENLYAWTNKPTLAYAAKAWVDEKDFYRYGKVGDAATCTQEPCGHYTQIIWKDTKKVGCAMSQYTAGTFNGGYVVVCKYQTPGNYIGETPY